MSKRISPTPENLRLQHLVTQHELNPQGTLFGGKLLGWMDQAGAIAAIKHCKKRVLLLKVDETIIKKPMYVPDLVSVHAEVASIGDTSITVNVDVWREKVFPVGETEWTAGGTLTYVAVDDNLKPTKVEA